MLLTYRSSILAWNWNPWNELGAHVCYYMVLFLSCFHFSRWSIFYAFQSLSPKHWDYKNVLLPSNLSSSSSPSYSSSSSASFLLLPPLFLGGFIDRFPHNPGIQPFMHSLCSGSTFFLTEWLNQRIAKVHLVAVTEFLL